MTHRTSRCVRASLLASVLALPLVPSVAHATSLPDRTVRVTVAPNGQTADGGSADPVLSADAGVLAFDSAASNLVELDPNGPVRDVFAVDLRTDQRRLVSAGLGGVGADGPSVSPAIGRGGARVAFVSYATNLVEGDVNGVPDVFVRDGDGPITRVGPAGGEPNGASYEPDLSDDGRFLVFTSEASNLVPDDTNGEPDVFLQDLQTGATRRVSITSAGRQATGRSSGASISADGRVVSYTSSAPDLVARDTNGVPDVFVRVQRTGLTQRVSISSNDVQQEQAVAAPFRQVSDVSADGRYVVFDSDATKLTKGDANKRTDVFLRDRRERTTTLVSASSIPVQGNNDSFAPSITPSGRHITFQSFATNLAEGDGPREDVFVRDLEQGTTSVVNATSSGAPRLGELVPQLLQRPALSADATFAAFSSTAPNLVAGDDNAAEDVFVRQLDAPTGRVASAPKPDRKGTVRLIGDDPLATTFLCQVDDQTPFTCGTSVPVKRGLGRWLYARAGGPGMLFAPDRFRVRLSNDRRGPLVRIGGLSKAHRGFGTNVRVLRGTATDGAGVAKVEVGVVYLGAGSCRVLVKRTKFQRGSCFSKTFVPATGRRSWRLRLPNKVLGPVAIYARAVDRLGNRGRTVTLKGLAL